MPRAARTPASAAEAAGKSDSVNPLAEARGQLMIMQATVSAFEFDVQDRRAGLADVEAKLESLLALAADVRNSRDHAHRFGGLMCEARALDYLVRFTKDAEHEGMVRARLDRQLLQAKQEVSVIERIACSAASYTGASADESLRPQVRPRGPRSREKLALAVARDPQEEKRVAREALARLKTLVQQAVADLTGAPPPLEIDNGDVCKQCGNSYTLSANGAHLICFHCSTDIRHIDNTPSSMAYGDEVEMSVGSYHASSQCNVWLKKIQAKGSRVMPPEIVETVRQHFLDEGYVTFDHLTYDVLRQAMRRCGLSKFYVFDVQIMCTLKGIPPPRFTYEQETFIRIIFRGIERPCIRWRNRLYRGRTNFISYPLCLYMICLLLGWVELLPYFTLLKGKDKLKNQLIVFRGVCRDLDWDFIPAPNLLAPSNAATRKKKAATARRAAAKQQRTTGAKRTQLQPPPLPSFDDTRVALVPELLLPPPPATTTTTIDDDDASCYTVQPLFLTYVPPPQPASTALAATSSGTAALCTDSTTKRLDPPSSLSLIESLF